MSETSLALRNLRALTILFVVSFHSVLAYMAWQPASQAPFDAPPYDWRAIPILDHQRWFGFDLYCAFQYVFLMPLMFFLSGLFVWPSLKRHGPPGFLHARLVRLGLPFILVVYLLMPVAHYPVYRITARDPSWTAFWAHWFALPFWATGPLWFLWQLLVLDIAAAALYCAAPRLEMWLGELSTLGREAPSSYIRRFVVVSTIAYVPFALLFEPWHLSQFGPFAFQPSRLLQYAVYFFAGVGIGAGEIGNGLLAARGWLAQRWRAGAAVALGTFLLWMMVTGLTLQYHGRAVLVLEAAAAVVFAVAAASACFGLIAIFLRFGVCRWSVAESLSENAYGIYLIHYLFVIWLQYWALGLALSAILKAGIVFTGALGLSWGASILVGHMPGGSRLIRASPPRRASRATAE
jgi:surface polysaccharide O-acyltransferase-like enzyme